MTVETDDSNDPAIPSNLFENVTYYLIGNIGDEVKRILNAGGAKEDTYLSQMVTHVIADNTEHGEYCEAIELFELPVVTKNWVILSARCGKQLPKEMFALEGLIFSGVVVCPSQLEDDDCWAVWGMVTYNGGQCQVRLDNVCTHLITSETSGDKYVAALKVSDKIKVVTPDWVVDSINKKTKEDETLYHPNLLEYPRVLSPVVIPEPEPMVAEIPEIVAPSIHRHYQRVSLEEMSGTPSAKEKLARMVSNRLQASGRGVDPQDVRRGMNGVEERGPAPGPRHADLHHRMLKNITNNAESKGPPSRPATIKLSLLETSPMTLMGRPPPPYSMRPMTPHIAPIYCGHDPSDNVPPDMCLLGCVFYVSDYQKLLGPDQIATWKQIIEQHGGQVDSSYSNRVTHLLCCSQQNDVFQLALKDGRRVITAFWLNDCLIKKTLMPPWQPLHLPLVYGDQKPCSNQIICVSNYEGDERIRIKQMVNAIGAKYTGYMTHSNSVLICRRPEGLKYQKAREWQIPVVNVQWLSELVLGNLDALKLPVRSAYLQLGMPDEFCLQLHKVGHLMVGWRAPLKIPRDMWKKFVSKVKSPKGPAYALQSAQVSSSDFKKPRLSDENINTTPARFESTHRIVFTGYPASVLNRLKALVQQLGGVVVENPRNCTHLVAQALTRTMKFFVAINVCKCITTKEWLEDSIQRGYFVDPEKYHLKDRHSEAFLNCDLAESMSRAQDKSLFKGFSFYITPSVTPSPSEMRSVIDSAAGVVVKRRPSANVLCKQKNEKGPRFIVITCTNDIHICRDLLAKNIDVYSAEFVLTGVIRQEIDYDLYKLEFHTT